MSRIPLHLLYPLQIALKLRNFVETGTYYGETTSLMAPVFDAVHTIELDPQMAARSRQQFQAVSNVTCWEGDSSAILPMLISKLDAPTAFWLDGHYSGPGTACGTLECPLLGELTALQRFPHHGLILIDDARYFVNPPPPPHDTSHWPTLGQLMEIAKENAEQRWLLVDDVIAIIPMTEHTEVWYRHWRDLPIGRRSRLLHEGANRVA